MNIEIFIVITLLIFMYIAFVLYNETTQEDAVRKALPRILSNEWTSGKEIHRQLRDEGIRLSVVRFYMIMRSLTEEEVIISRNVEYAIDEERICQPHYLLLAD